MRGGLVFALLFLLVFIVLVDWLTFRGIRLLAGNLISWLRTTVYLAHWMVPVVLLMFMGWILIQFSLKGTLTEHRTLYTFLGMFILFYIPKLIFIVFQLGNDLMRLTGIFVIRLSDPVIGVPAAGTLLSRAEFLTRIGIVVAIIPFVSILHGIWKGRYDYQVKKISLQYENLPPAFNGLKIIQISDWHIGSFSGRPQRVKEAVDIINSQHADVILFTGDLVSNTASEVDEFVPILQELYAPMGKFSILGNHDYGDYVHWDSKEAYQKNLEDLYACHQMAGFRLLRNESVYLEKEGQKIGLAGVENWGSPPFPQYGDLNKALQGIPDAPFKILISHDPSHWDAEILKTDIDLTLSGHTHGFQFGINKFGIKWSPVKWKYPRWQGLYRENNQVLYVNVGIGYIAFPGRVGFLPEITVIEILSTDN